MKLSRILREQSSTDIQAEIRDFLERDGISEHFDVYVHDDGTIDIYGSKSKNTIFRVYDTLLKDSPTGGRVLRYKFGKIGCSFRAASLRLSSMEGFPREIDGYLDVSDNNLTNLEGIPEKTGMGLELFNNVQLRSLAGIGDKVRHIEKGELTLPLSINSSVLGILKIGGNFRTSLLFKPKNQTPLSMAINIIEKHRAAGGDIIACKKELIANNLKEFAKL